MERAAIEADLPGILRAYGWRAVRGEDAHDRRVLTDSAGDRRVVVSRDPESRRWQWWETGVEVVGTIVDALRELIIGFQLLRDIVMLLRRALNDPPGPLPVLAAEDQDVVLSRETAPSNTEQVNPLKEQHHEQPTLQFEPLQSAIGVVSEEPTESIDEPATDDIAVGSDESFEATDTSDATLPEDVSLKPARRGRRGR